jgi:hypothetical protein
LAGGGCVSVLFFGSASDASLRVLGNRFAQCEVAVSGSDNVAAGNGASALHGAPALAVAWLSVVPA